jgi:hypothetical protein
VRSAEEAAVELNTSAERLRVQIEALAKEYDIRVPDPAESND